MSDDKHFPYIFAIKNWDDPLLNEPSIWVSHCNECVGHKNPIVKYHCIQKRFWWEMVY